MSSPNLMSSAQSDNRRFILRLWLPVVFGAGLLAIMMLAALTAGDLRRTLPVILGVAVAVMLVVRGRSGQKRRVERMLQEPDPAPFLRSFEASTRRMPHGVHLAAANSATILALYGRVEDAERSLKSVSWQTVPPFIQAQGSAARAAIAYARGAALEGLDHAATATQQASLNSAVPGARASELAFRTYRNLGLALSGRATNTTIQELNDARARLPLVGQVLAVWGLAAIAKNTNDTAQLQAMQQFIVANGPHLTAVVESTRAG